MDDDTEVLPLVDETGAVRGRITRGEAHSGRGLLHPVVLLFVFTPDGHLLLQKRSGIKKICPGLWDSTSGGHVAFGESKEVALRRETLEEIGLDLSCETLFYVGSNVHDIDNNRQLVYVYATTTDARLVPDGREVTGIESFSLQQVVSMVSFQHDSLTPLLVYELTALVLQYWKTHFIASSVANLQS